MISQPMAGKPDAEISRIRNGTKAILENLGFEVINTWFPEYTTSEGTKNKPLVFLAKVISKMPEVDLVVFCEGWSDARGCWIEYEIAKAYGIPCMELA